MTCEGDRSTLGGMFRQRQLERDHGRTLGMPRPEARALVSGKRDTTLAPLSDASFFNAAARARGAVPDFFTAPDDSKTQPEKDLWRFLHEHSTAL